MNPKDAVTQREPEAVAVKVATHMWAIWLKGKKISGHKLTALSAWSDAWRRMCKAID